MRHPAHPDYHHTLFNSVFRDPATIAISTAVMTGISTAVGAASTIAQGNAAKTAANYQAAQLQQQAGQSRATAQRQQIEQARVGAYALSRSRAVAAASGGGASDPTVVNNEENIAGQSEYNQLSALFNGEERARGMEQQAQTDIYQGKQEKRASLYKGAGTLLQGGETLFSQYGWGNPSKSPDAAFDNGTYGPSNLPWQNTPGYQIPN